MTVLGAIGLCALLIGYGWIGHHYGYKQGWLEGFKARGASQLDAKQSGCDTESGNVGFADLSERQNRPQKR